MSELLLSCRQAAQEIKKNKPRPIQVRRLSSTHLSLYFTLLRRLKIIEDDKSFDLKADRKTLGLHAEVYDALILLAPFFQRRNLMLEPNFRYRKEAMGAKSETS